jgi:hypothetical protein
VKFTPLALVGALMASSCGYHVAGHVNTLPESIHSIAVVAFLNATTQYHIADKVTADITRELIQRTHLQIITDPLQADAVLSGSLVNYYSYPTTYDPVTGRASGVFVAAFFQVTLKERVSGKVIYNRPNLEIHERYEISVDPKTYFDEGGGAVDRLTRDTAQTVVSGILERF